MIYHTAQEESSHSQCGDNVANHIRMDVDETFRAKLLAIRQAKGLSAAELSRAAKLNIRAVKDIEEGRAISPKISTVFAIARALSEDPAEMMGLGPRVSLQADLVRLLAQYSEEEQSRLVAALAALLPAHD